MVGGMAAKSLDLSNGGGTSFYECEQIPDIKGFIIEWCGLLNDLDLTAEQNEEIVDEANLVFDLI